LIGVIRAAEVKTEAVLFAHGDYRFVVTSLRGKPDGVRLWGLGLGVPGRNERRLFGRNIVVGFLTGLPHWRPKGCPIVS